MDNFRTYKKLHFKYEYSSFSSTIIMKSLKRAIFISRSFEMRGPYVVIFPHETPIWEWQMIGLVVKNIHQKDTWHKEIGQHVLDIDNFLDWLHWILYLVSFTIWGYTMLYLFIYWCSFFLPSKDGNILEYLDNQFDLCWQKHELDNK